MTDAELRTCPLSGRRTLVAAGRAGRPGGGPTSEGLAAVDPDDDPFLEGREDQTPPELDAIRPDGSPPDGPGWLARAIPNRWPLVAEDAPEPAAEAQPMLFQAVRASGRHEVVVQAPGPVRSLAELDPGHVACVVELWQRRLTAHRGAPARHLIVNEGSVAGASQAHTHAQLVTLPVVPADLARERERAEAYAVQTMGGSLAGDLLQEEVRRGERIVAVDDDVVLLAPWASRTAFHLSILPRSNALRLEDEAPGTGGPMLQRALAALARRFDGPVPLTLYVRTAVSGAERTAWRIELMPRITALGGVELGAGVDVCTVAPEQAAAELRDAWS